MDSYIDDCNKKNDVFAVAGEIMVNVLTGNNGSG